jgi:arylsulfatase A-like enzyme
MKHLARIILLICLLPGGGCRDRQGGGEVAEPRLISKDYALLHHIGDADLQITRSGDRDFEDLFKRREVTIGGSRRFGFCMASESRAGFDVRILKAPRLCFGIGLLPRTGGLPGDGATFAVSVQAGDGRETLLYEKHLSRPEEAGSARWIDETVDLADYEGRAVRLTLRVGPGPMGDARNDFAVWSHPVIYQQGEVFPGRRREGGPNILLVTADTLRADYLGCAGHPGIDTPCLDGLAREGVLFEQAYTAANNTNPSHMSILTALTPQAHGVYTNHHRLDARYRILSQRFQDAAYYTGAVLSAPWLSDRVTGLDRGFDEFHEAENTKRAAFTTAEAMAFVTANYDRPFFLWVHYFDPHTRYDPPPPFDTRYTARREARPGEKTLLEKHAWFQGRRKIYASWLAGVADASYPEGQYRGEISYLDHAFEKLLRRLETLGIDGNTVVAFTADHGELLGEHGIFYAHRGLWEPNVRVPLILRYPAGLPSGRRIGQTVRTLDIAPTLLALAGLELPGDPMDGVSLLPLIEAREAVDRTAVIAHADELATALRRGPWKLIVTRQPGAFLHDRRALYHLGDDPEERHNLYEREPDIAAELEALLKEHEGKYAKINAVSGDISDGMREKLQAMGYLEE